MDPRTHRELSRFYQETAFDPVSLAIGGTAVTLIMHALTRSIAKYRARTRDARRVKLVVVAGPKLETTVAEFVKSAKTASESNPKYRPNVKDLQKQLTVILLQTAKQEKISMSKSDCWGIAGGYMDAVSAALRDAGVRA